MLIAALMSLAVDQWAQRRITSDDLAAIWAFLWVNGGREQWIQEHPR